MPLVFQKLVLPEPLIVDLVGLIPGAFADIFSGIIFRDKIDLPRLYILKMLPWPCLIFLVLFQYLHPHMFSGLRK